MAWISPILTDIPVHCGTFVSSNILGFVYPVVNLFGIVEIFAHTDKKNKKNKQKFFWNVPEKSRGIIFRCHIELPNKDLFHVVSDVISNASPPYEAVALCLNKPAFLLHISLSSPWLSLRMFLTAHSVY